MWTIRLLTGALPAVASIAALGFKRAFYLYPQHMPDVQKGIEALTNDPKERMRNRERMRATGEWSKLRMLTKMGMATVAASPPTGRRALARL